MADDRPAWCVHMPRTLGSKPITEGFIAIGWAEAGDLSKLPKAREAFREIVARTYPDRKPGSFPVTGGTLFKFVHEMERRDVVIHPSKIDRLVHIGMVDGDYIHLTSGEGLPNRRKVKWLKQVPRAAFSQSALHEIGTAVTLSQVRNHLDEFLAALKGETLEPEEIDDAVTESPSEETEEATKDFVLKRLKSQLDPYQFEHFVAHLLKRMGYHTRVTQQSSDGGIDILASRMNWASRSLSSRYSASRSYRRRATLKSRSCMAISTRRSTAYSSLSAPIQPKRGPSSGRSRTCD